MQQSKVNTVCINFIKLFVISCIVFNVRAWPEKVPLGQAVLGYLPEKVNAIGLNPHYKNEEMKLEIMKVGMLASDRTVSTDQIDKIIGEVAEIDLNAKHLNKQTLANYIDDKLRGEGLGHIDTWYPLFNKVNSKVHKSMQATQLIVESEVEKIVRQEAQEWKARHKSLNLKNEQSRLMVFTRRGFFPMPDSDSVFGSVEVSIRDHIVSQNQEECKEVRHSMLRSERYPSNAQEHLIEMLNRMKSNHRSEGQEVTKEDEVQLFTRQFRPKEYGDERFKFNIEKYADFELFRYFNIKDLNGEILRESVRRLREFSEIEQKDKVSEIVATVVHERDPDKSKNE